MPGAKSLAKNISEFVITLPARQQEVVKNVKPIASYSHYLSSEVRKATVEGWDPHSQSGKASLYPSATRLATAKTHLVNHRCHIRSRENPRLRT